MVKNFHLTNSPRSSLVGASVSRVPIIREYQIYLWGLEKKITLHICRLLLLFVEVFSYFICRDKEMSIAL